MPLKIGPHEWIREVREDKGIRQSDVEDRTAQLGARHKISQSHLSKIEKGRAPLAGLGAERMDALRQVLGISPAEWAEKTGFQIVTPTPEAAPAAEQRRLRPIPDALADMIEEKKELAPELMTERWQQYLAGQRFSTGEASPERWWNLYLLLKNAGVEPGGH